MVDKSTRSKWLVACLLFLPGLLTFSAVVTAQSSLGNEVPNPHSDLIFRATGTHSCRDCHVVDNNGGLSPRPIENEFVSKLRDKAKGIHGPGRFADCLRCHAGGRKGVEKY